jgi:hypothetical protein
MAPQVPQADAVEAAQIRFDDVGLAGQQREEA